MDIKVVDDLLSQVNIVNVIERYIPLTKAGSNYKALCPFHDEKTPSFSVSEKLQIFKCFGCDAKGNAVSFVRDYEKISFWEAVRKVADMAGYILPESNYDKQKKSKFDLIYQAYKLAKDYFAKNLNEYGDQAQKYLDERGITKEIREKFGFGYAMNSYGGLSNYLLKHDIKPEILPETGLFGSNERGIYDLFRDRLMIPIHSSSGKVVAFGGRKLDESQPGGKYINSPTTVIYTKGRELFGLNVTKYDISKRDHVLVSEGYLDMLRLYEQGFINTVASLGTALTSEQISLLGRYTQNVYIMYDGDEAGIRAALKGAAEVTRHGFQCRIVALPLGEDPDSYLLNNGKEALQKLIDNAMTLQEYFKEEKILGLSTNKKVNFLIDVARDIAGDIDRSLFLKGVSETFEVSYPAIISRSKNKIIFQDYNVTLDYLNSNKYPEERLLLKLMMEDKELVEKIGEDIDASWFFEAEYREIFEVLIEHNGKLNQVSSYQMVVSPEVWARMSEIMLMKTPQVEIEKIVRDVKLRKYRQDLAAMDKIIQAKGQQSELFEKYEELKKKVRELDPRGAQKLLY
ncbi:MAG: DNA primase [Candidatus Stygibacter frigidus]|nr:DNA primase [Candidatus Stygibacter frigidus]